MNTNTLYPVFLKLEQLNVLIVGGGTVGLEKLTNILRSSPKSNITIIAPNFHYQIEELSHFYSNITLLIKEYHISDIEDVNLVIGATNNRALNAQIKQDANKKQLLVNVADDPELCDFYLGSVVTKGPLKIGISTNGQSPTLAKKMRLFFEDVVPDEVAFSAQVLNNVRKKIKSDLRYKVATLNNVTSVLDSTSKLADEVVVKGNSFKIHLN